MSKPFRSCAFARWVPEFVASSHRRSGIRRPPSVAEIAAYRGLFALERIAVENVAVFLHHAVGPGAAPAAADPLLKACLLELNAPDLDIDGWFDRFLMQRPLADGNARCARALRKWYRLRSEEADLGPGAAEAGPEPWRPAQGPRSLPH